MSYSQPSDKGEVGVAYDHHKMIAARNCLASKVNSKPYNKSWRYLEGGSPEINMMMIDWHGRGENSFGPITNI